MQSTFMNKLAPWIALLGAATLFVLLWAERRTAITLPNPTGPFSLGRVSYDWTDDHEDKLAPVAGTKRELLVWIWYPSTERPASTEDYLPAPASAAAERSRGPLIRFLTRDLSKVHSHSHPNADVSVQQAPYPVVILRGGASAEVWNYSTLAEDLASHGYVVAGIDAPFRTMTVVFPDDRVTSRTPENNLEEAAGNAEITRAIILQDAWTADIALVLDRLRSLNTADRFAGKLDLTRVGVFGHSFGGAQAAQFCSQDSRCKAGIDIDGLLVGSVIEKGVHRPFMFLLSDHAHESDPEAGRIRAEIQSVYERVPAGERLRVTIRGANHYTFGDDGALLKSHLIPAVLRALGMLSIDGPRQLAITTYCVRTFFDAYLKGGPPPKLDTARYPELQVAE
jgi:predicted dienelactone hydrolase